MKLNMIAIKSTVDTVDKLHMLSKQNYIKVAYKKTL